MMRALASLVALLAARAAAIEEDGVLVLTASNFQNKVNEQYDTGMMVEFYAPWCKHCQALAPVYAEAAQALKGDVVLAKIDATQAQALAQQHGVTGYPSVKFFKQGRVIDAQGVGMEAEQIVKAAQRLSQERCGYLGDDAAVEAAATGPGVRVLAFFKTNKTKAARSFLNAVDEFRYPIDFFIGTDDALKSKAFAVAERRFLNEGKADESSLLDDPLAKLKPLSLGAVPKGPVALLVKPYDERVAFLKLGDGKDGRKKLEKWLEEQMMPLVVPFLPEYVDMIFGGPLQMHAVLAVDPQSDFAAERDAFYGAAIANRGKVLHIIMFKPPDDDGDADEDEVAARDELRAVLSFLKIDRTPALVMSDMTVATEAEPRGKQETFAGDLRDKAAVLEFQQTYAAKAVARKAGLDPKMAEIMSDPKMQEMIKDEKMSSMLSIMGMPQQLVDIYKSEL